MEIDFINPESLPKPSGFNHGLVASGGGRILFVAGQTAANSRGDVTTDDFVKQFDMAVVNVVEVVRKAGGGPQNLMTMTIYTTRLAEYKASLRLLGETYQRRLGGHVPAVTVVEVQELLNSKAKVEVQAVAVLDS